MDEQNFFSVNRLNCCMVVVLMGLFLHGGPYVFLLLWPNMFAGDGLSSFFIHSGVMSVVLGNEVSNGFLDFIHIDCDV